MNTVLTPEALTAAQHLLWHRGVQDAGTRPSPFVSALLRALDKGNTEEEGRLLDAFPEYLIPVAIIHRSGVSSLARVVRDQTQGAA